MSKQNKQVKSLLNLYFLTMSDDTITDDKRESMLDDIRAKVEKFSNELFISAVNNEIKGSSGGFVYQLFLKNIVYMGKL